MDRIPQAREKAAAAYQDGMLRFSIIIAVLPDIPENGRVRRRMISDLHDLTRSFLRELQVLTSEHGMTTVRNSALFNDELKADGVAAGMVARLLAAYRDAEVEDFTKLVAEYPKGFRNELFDYIKRHQ